MIARQEATIDWVSTSALFEQILAANPDKRVIPICCDSAPYYISRQVAEWVAEKPIELHFLPSYSPNLNPIERLWKFMPAKVIDSVYYPVFSVFKDAVMAFFKPVRTLPYPTRRVAGTAFCRCQQRWFGRSLNELVYMLKKVFLLIALTAQLAGAQTKSKITVTDLTRIKQVGGIQLSPDGQRAVYVLTTIETNPDQKDEYDYRTHIYLTQLKPGDARALTRGPESARQAVWSPDGKSIAFARLVKGKSQVFVMPLDGGEAWQLTNGPYGASEPMWSPDGKRIAFTATVSMAEMLSDSLLNPGKDGPAWSLEKPGFADNTFVKEDKKIKPNPDGSLAEIRAYLAKDVADKKGQSHPSAQLSGRVGDRTGPQFHALVRH